MTTEATSATRDAALDFDAFCVEAHQPLVAAVSLYCGSLETAEDAVQEALARACLRWRTVGRHANPAGWVYRVATNLTKSHLRRLTMRRRVEPRTWSSSVHYDADAGDAVAVREALRALKSRTRTAIVLRYYLGYSVAETASAMRMPPNTVKTLVRRGLADMQQRLGEHLEAPSG